MDIPIIYSDFGFMECDLGHQNLSPSVTELAELKELTVLGITNNAKDFGVARAAKLHLRGYQPFMYEI
jgi:hypothetical protein